MFPKSSLTFMQYPGIGKTVVARAEITLSTQRAIPDANPEEVINEEAWERLKQDLTDQLNTYVFGKLRRAIFEAGQGVIQLAGLSPTHVSEIVRIFEELEQLTQPPTEVELEALGYPIDGTHRFRAIEEDERS